MYSVPTKTPAGHAVQCFHRHLKLILASRPRPGSNRFRDGDQHRRSRGRRRRAPRSTRHQQPESAHSGTCANRHAEPVGDALEVGEQMRISEAIEVRVACRTASSWYRSGAEGAPERLGVADYVAPRDPGGHQPATPGSGAATHHVAVAEHPVRTGADGALIPIAVQFIPIGAGTAHPQAHGAGNRPVDVDQEARRAPPGFSPRWGAVGGEVVPRRVERGSVRVVLDDDFRVRVSSHALAVVAHGVRRRLPLSARANGIFFQIDLQPPRRWNRWLHGPSRPTGAAR